MGFLKNLSAKSRSLLLLTLLLAGLVPLTVYSSLQRKSQTTRAATQTITLTVSAGADDAHQNRNSTVVVSNDTNISMISSTSPYLRYSGGFRFTNVTIPKDSTINSAFFQPYVYTTAYDNPDVDIFANAVANAADFNTERSIIGRARTGNHVSWVATNIGIGYPTSPPDIKNVIQEIVNNQPGWSSGNAIALLVDGKTSSVIKYFIARSYEYPSSAAKLTITYTPPPPPCSDECSSSECTDGTHYKTCGYFDADPCLDWSSATSCQAGQTCSGGNCITTPTKPTVSIQASPASIKSGQSATLSWSSTGATSVSITPGIGTVGTSGSKTVKPNASITYTAVASGPGGTSSPAYASIKVDDKPVPCVNCPPPDGKILESLQLEIAVPNLKGKAPFKVEISGASQEIQLEGRWPKTYSLNLKEAQLALNQEYTVVIRSEKSLAKKVKFTPQSAESKLTIGDLILGDLNQDNYISLVDQAALVSFVASQNSFGDLNGDERINSFDWAILWENFGKNGD